MACPVCKANPHDANGDLCVCDAALNVLEIARMRLTDIQNFKRPATTSQEQFIFNLQSYATQALVNIDDPSTALTERDRSIREECAQALDRKASEADRQDRCYFWQEAATLLRELNKVK